MSERAQIRQQQQASAQQTLQQLITKTPNAEAAYQNALGYFVGEVYGAQIAIVGGGVGSGVLHNKIDDTYTYMNINRFDLGPGFSAGRYKIIAFFNDQTVLEEFSLGKRYQTLGAETSVGNSGGVALSNKLKGLELFFIGESGAAVTLTTRLVKISINTDLTDTGLAQVSIPNTKNHHQIEEKHAPRQWNRALPFLAQEVIDQGYDLPLPYGFGLTYANVDQAMILEDLEVGINGNDKEVFEFVDFDNAFAYSDSIQAKFDTWLFPFMNVFALLGKIEGNAELDVNLDGNLMLEHLGTNCEGIIKPPACLILSDRIIPIPIDTNFSGKTYGLGTVLAGGWNNWFVTIPVSVVYADMNNTNTDGLAITFTPRAGYLFDLANAGQLATYVGGNYLDADLTVTGTVGVEGFTIDYTIEQSNTDNWNTVVGANWDITKSWSVMLEYNGFTGSRDAVISSLVFRL